MHDEQNNARRKRKHPRLDLSLYAETGHACSITIAVKERLPVFANYLLANAAVETLRQMADKNEVLVHAYCIMPDHVHLLLEPSETCDIVTYVGRFKNLVLKEAWKLGVKRSFWQKSFWDHFLRHEEGLNEAIEYILNNPVRRGLVGEWQNYLFGGSLVHDLEGE